MRKLATAAAVSLVLSSGGVRALGLGDIEMRSALNQPMNAEIRLTSVQPGEAEGMIVKLASQEAFQRAGIDRSPALTDLRFSVDQSSGTPVIAISSTRPVVEPFLNFLLEVDWPAGRMVREYTVLLDPPVFLTPSANSQPAAEQPAILQRSDNTLNAPAPIDRGTEITFAESDFEVEVVGSAEEISDNAVLPGEIITSDVSSAGTFTPDLSTDGGEVVSLDDLGGTPVTPTFDGGVGTVELIGESAGTLDPFSADGGEVVVLSDLGAPNDDAAVQFQEEQFASGSASDFQFDVEVVGSNTEVDDSFRVEGDQFAGSEAVSLDSIGSSATDGEVTVQRGDTLLMIATANAAPGVSPQQMMMALLNANQSAFINGNVNLVRAGAILRIPDSGEVSQLSQTQAVAQLGEQNQLWREYRDNIRGSSGTRIASAPQAPEAESEGLSAAAQRILDTATAEALSRQDLSIVAQNESSTTSASATADNSEGSEQAQLGEINKKLQLAKEELASTRLETADLSEQSADLQSTTENQEALVAIRQQEVAALQQQLAQADSDAAGISDNDLLANAQNAVTNAGDSVTDAAGSVLEGGENAITAAGEELGQVELVDDTVGDAVLEAEAVVEPAAQNASTPWYMDLLQKYGKWIVIGIGALSALFAGILLLGRRKKKNDDRLDYDDVEFFDEEDDGVELHVEGAGNKESSGIGSAVAAGAAGAAAVGGVAAVAGSGGASAGTDASAGTSAQDSIDDQEAFNADMDSVGTNEVGESSDPDDTISEVDVYLAYGLHGQAEELLAKAIEREPNNPEYALKLLQTQHAQGNSDAFADGAQSYHERFGGDNSPSWGTVCEMGYDLTPNNTLFAGSAESIESVGGEGGVDASTLDDNDFLSNTESESVSSVSRDFGEAGETEVDLMDQSLDPAFAFDETDLEATGDFSQIADEIASEDISVGGGSLDTSALDAGGLGDDTSLDFPGFDAAESLGDKAGGLADAGKGKLGDAASSLKGGIGGIGAMAAGGAAALGAGGLASKAASAKDGATDMFDDALSLDDLDSAANDGLTGTVSEDLTLDLDQLSGDIELDGADLLDQTSTEALDDLQIPDLTGDNELLTNNVDNIESSDEMDTMMDLAKAYIDMGDKDSASSALGEIVKSGNPAQVSEAETLLRKIS